MIDSYNGGYTKALLDVREVLEKNSVYLKTCKLFNRDGILKLMDELIYRRVELRETGKVNLLYNVDKKVFVHDQDRKR